MNSSISLIFTFVLFISDIYGQLDLDNSSLTSNSSYTEFCLKAAKDALIFENFKTNSAYTGVLEHVSEGRGAKYLSYIKNNYPFLYANISQFKTNDFYGNPRVYSYPEVGKISPTTLRYVKVLGDLLDLYGGIDGFNIIEIGCGYGGQCLIANTYSPVESYTLLDLPEVILLAKTYLGKFDYNNIIYKDPLDETDLYDLVISNFAFSECSKKFQLYYIEKILSKSAHGYLTLNFIGKNGERAPFSKVALYKELERHGISFKELSETPLTNKKNSIIYW